MMNKASMFLGLVLLASGVAVADDSSSSSSGSSGDVVLTPEMVRACNMMLCLAPDGKSQAECADPLKDYEDMKPHKRPGFLAKCPSK